jgi:hypothetical protein
MFRLGSSRARWAGSLNSLRKSLDMLLTCPPLLLVLLGRFSVQKGPPCCQVPMSWCMECCSRNFQCTLFLASSFSRLPLEDLISTKGDWFDVQASTVNTSLQRDSHFHSCNQSLLNGQHVKIVFVILEILRTVLNGRKLYCPCSYKAMLACIKMGIRMTRPTLDQSHNQLRQ